MNFLQTAATLALLPGVAMFTSASSQPAEYSSSNGVLNVKLSVGMVWSLDNTRYAPGYNGQPIGPTLRVKQGERLIVTLENNLDPVSDYERELYEYTHDVMADDVNLTMVYNRLDSVGNWMGSALAPTCPCFDPWGHNYMNLHFHGCEFDPAMEDVHSSLGGGESKTYSFQVPDDHPPGLNWYHNHFHGTGAYSMMSGLYGFIVVDEKDAPPETVPKTATVEDENDMVYSVSKLYSDATEVFLMLSESYVDQDTSIPKDDIGMVGAFDWNHTTNGQINPTYSFTQGETVLFRAANAGVEPSMKLSISDGNLGENLMMTSVAQDGFPNSLLETLDHVHVPTGSRTEFLVRFDEVGTFTMERAGWNPANIKGIETCSQFGFPADECFSFDVPKTVATIVVEAPTSTTPQPSMDIVLPPVSPVLQELADRPSVANKTISFDFDVLGEPDQLFQIPSDGKFVPPGVGFGINGRMHNPNYNHGTVEAGTCETWLIKTLPEFEHTFHVHGHPFLVTHMNEVPVEVPFWRDTMPLLNDNMTVHICFDRFDAGIVTVHCHMPLHQDKGMGAQYEIVPPPSDDDESIDETSAAATRMPTILAGTSLFQLLGSAVALFLGYVLM